MTAPVQPEVPSPVVGLHHEGRMYLLSLVHYRILCGEPVDEQYWRDAFGQAADYQTVLDARRELARQSVSA